MALSLTDTERDINDHNVKTWIHTSDVHTNIDATKVIVLNLISYTISKILMIHLSPRVQTG